MCVLLYRQRPIVRYFNVSISTFINKFFTVEAKSLSKSWVKCYVFIPVILEQPEWLLWTRREGKNRDLSESRLPSNMDSRNPHILKQFNLILILIKTSRWYNMYRCVPPGVWIISKPLTPMHQFWSQKLPDCLASDKHEERKFP